MIILAHGNWHATTGGGLHHHYGTTQLTTMVMSSLLNVSVGHGAVRLLIIVI